MKLLSALFLILMCFLFGAAVTSLLTSPVPPFAFENLFRLTIMLCTACAALLHLSRIR